MNTLRLKSILATLIMILVSGGTWAEEITVGTGTEARKNFPIDCGGYSSTSESIYSPEELEGKGVITSIAYNVSSIENANSSPIEIYLRHKIETSYSNDYDFAPSNELTLVYSGVVAFQEGWNTIEFDVPFNYNGSDNLEVVTCRKSPGSGVDVYFYCTDIYPNYKTLYRHSSSSNYGNITYTNGFARNTYRPNTEFYIRRQLQSYTLNGVKYEYKDGKAYVLDSESATGAITIPSTIQPGDGNTYTVIGLRNGVFENNTNITSVNIPSTVTNLPHSLFKGCTKLTSITIPSSITSLTDNMFKGCTSLTSYTIPISITSIGNNVFDGCTNLKSLTFNVTEPAILVNTNSLPYDVTLYVPTDAVDTYKTADKWSDHKDQIMAVGTKTDYDFTGFYAVTAESGRSVLHTRIGEDQLAEVISLKVEGTINSYDLMVMRNKMIRLRRLDLSKATIIANSYEYYTGYCSTDNTLTYWALNDNLYSVKLPKTLTKINSDALTNLKNITELEIPANVTEIANNAANGLTKLKVLTFAINSQCTTIGYEAFNGCSALEKVSIPANTIRIGDNAFKDCSSLSELVFEDGEKILKILGYTWSGSHEINGIRYCKCATFQNCPIKKVYIGRNLQFYNKYDEVSRLCINNTYLQSVEFGEYASVIDDAQFAGCTNLTEVKGLENIKSIGKGAFYRCSSLESLTIPSNVTTIEPWAFRNSGLKSMNIPAGVKTLGNYAFAECSNLEEFTFSDDCELTAIPDYFLYDAVKLDNIALPKNTLTIGDYAFYGCTLMKECKISSKITKIGDYAFNQCNNLNSVYAYTFEPQTIDQNTFSTYHTATLHIPSASYLLYFYDTQWSQFLHLVGFDSEAEQVGINVDYHLYTETNGIIGGKPRVDIQGNGGLTIIGDIVQPFGDIHITANDTSFGSLVANGNITADKIYFDINVNKDKWYFFCFPFDIPLANITKQGSFKWAMYDGSVRATNGTTGWKDLPSGTTMLLKGKGYIFRTNFEGELSLHVDNPTFDAINEQTTLTSYVSTNEANADWNMVGNPYPCYYPINKLQYGAPIIVWNGTGYDAYRPGDDDYVLHPFEAMFVQKPQMVNSVGFLAEWRQTYTESHPVSSSAKGFGTEFGTQASENARMLINLTLSNGKASDKTRVVFNETKSIDYEQECDAAKFESYDMPQLYSLGADGVKYAINERPVANGKVALGFYAPEEGIYTFSATRMDAKVYIYDAKTATTYDLSDGDFTFNAEQGTDNGRFTLIVADVATGINGIAAESESADKVYDLGGRNMNDAKAGIVIKNGKKVVVK